MVRVGAALVPVALHHLEPSTLLYAVLSLTVALTVMLSVVLHGVSASPLGRLYVRLEGSEASIEGQPISRRTVQT